MGFFSTLQLGGALTPYFAIHGGLSYASINGEFRSTGGDLPSHVSAEYNMLMPTLGFSFYIMPANIYISPEFHFAGSGEVSSDTDECHEDGHSFPCELDIDLESGTGFGLRIGKEWWTSANWGLGAALFYSQDTFDSGEDEFACGPGSEWDSTLYGISFSATFN